MNRHNLEPIYGRGIADAWRRLAHLLVVDGQPISPRSLACVELTNVTLHIEDATQNVFYHPLRKLNYSFMIAEWLWIYFGRDDAATIGRYNSKVLEFSDDGVRFAGAYGPPVRAQWPAIVELLQRDRDTRQAVISIFRPPTGPTKDVPCTIALQFAIRDDRLHVTASMRSSDLWLGLPYDVFTFTMLANALAATVGVPLGSFTIHLGSSHFYERDREKISTLLNQPSGFETIGSPRLKEAPIAIVERKLVERRGFPGVGDQTVWSDYVNALVSTREALNILRDIRDRDDRGLIASNAEYYGSHE